MPSPFESGRQAIERRRNENAGSMRWLLTYADMLTLLFVLFVVLFSLNAQNKQKLNPMSSEIVAAFHAAFHTPPPVGMPSDTANSAVRLSRTPAPQATTPEAAGAPATANLQQIANRLQAVLKSSGMAQLATIHLANNSIDLRFGARGYFRSASARLTPQFTRVLDAVAPVLRTVPYEMRVEGYTNDLPLHSNRYPTAWELAAARAVNTLRYLTEEKGISPHHVEADSFGQWHPRVPNDTARDLAMNRSVDIVITDQPPPGLDEGGPDVAPGGGKP